MKFHHILNLTLVVILLNGIGAEVTAQIFNPFPCNTQDLLPPACRNVCYRLKFETEGTATNWQVVGLSGTGLGIDTDTGEFTGTVQNGVLPGERVIQVSALIDGTNEVRDTFRLPILADESKCTPCITENTGRFPGQQPCMHEISFVLDSSLHMSSPLVPEGPSKWNVLRGIFYGFFQTMVATTNMDADDRFAITTISGNQARLNIYSPADVIPFLAPGPPSGAAPLGGGIQRSLVDFFPNIGDLGNGKKRTTLLITAGIQDRNPMIQLGKIINTLPNEIPPTGILQPPITGGYGTLPINFNDPAINKIGIYAIGLGTGIATSSHAILHDFSNSYGSTLEPGFVLNDFLNTTMVKALKTGTPRMLGLRKGNFSPGSLASESFTVNDSVNSLTIQIFNVDGTFNQPQTSLYQGETQVDIKSVFNNDRIILYDINFPDTTNIGLDNPQSSRGDWEIRFQDNTPFRYEVAAFVDETGIHHEIDFDGQKSFVAGETLPVRIKVWDREGPVTNANVAVTLERPGADLGDLAARTATPPIDVMGGISAGQSKINYLVRNNPEFVNQLEKTTEEQIDLRHSGDGYYTTTFTGNEVTGVYRIITHLNGVHRNLGPYEGREAAFTFFDFGDNRTINANERITLTDQGRGGTNTYAVSLEPTNQMDKKLGPDQLNRMKAKVTEGNIYDWKDNLDGSYQFNVNAPEGSNPKLSIFIIDTLKAVVIRRLYPTRFGISAHIGRLRAIGDNPPLDSLQNGVLLEADLTLQFSPKIALQVIGGQYNFEDKFKISGAGLFFEYSFVNRRSSGFYPRISGGAGYYKPDQQDGGLGLGLRLGLARQMSRNFNAGVDLGAFLLPKADYSFGFANLSLKYFF